MPTTTKPPITIQNVLDAAIEAKLSFSAFDVTTFINGIGQGAVTQVEVRAAFKNLFDAGGVAGYRVAHKKGDEGGYRWASHDQPAGDLRKREKTFAKKFIITPAAQPSPAVAAKAAAPAKVVDPPPVKKDGVQREVLLIYSDVGGNNNKVWKGILYDNGNVYTEWGRVGKNMQTKTYPNAGERKLASKEHEKLAKGYTHAQIVSSAPSTRTVQNGNLMDLAIKQISKGEPVLDKLVRQLVSANIHTITSQSNITFNETTGVFASPLGVVTLSAINEAHLLLDSIEVEVHRRGGTDLRSIIDVVNRYLRLIPQDFGMRLERDSPWLTADQRRQVCEQQNIGLEGARTEKPHGRMAWNLYLWAGTKVDLSILPRMNVPCPSTITEKTPMKYTQRNLHLEDPDDTQRSDGWLRRLVRLHAGRSWWRLSIYLAALVMLAPVSIAAEWMMEKSEAIFDKLNETASRLGEWGLKRKPNAEVSHGDRERKPDTQSTHKQP